MDRYDAILEHLKKAQSSGLDAVTSSFDAVVERLEELVQAAKSNFQEALPRDAEECFPVSDVEAIVAQLREEAARPSGISLEVLRTLDRARTQSELLRELLPMLAEHVGRAVVMVIRDGVVSAWSGIGFPDGERLKSWHGEVGASPVFERFVESALPLSFAPGTDPLFTDWLEGDGFPDEAVLLPISLRGKLMGMIYIDHSDDEPWDLDAAQTFITVACWLVDTLHHREEVPTPMLAEVAAFEVSADGPSLSEEVAEPETFEVEQEPEEVELPHELEPKEPEFEPEVAVEQPIEIEEPEAAEEQPIEIEIEEPEVVDAPAVDVVEGAEEAADFQPPSAEAEPEFGIPADEVLPAEPEVVEIDYDFEAEIDEGAGAEQTFDPSATLRVDVGEALVSHEIPAAPEVVAEPVAPSIPEVAAMPPPVQPLAPPPEVAEPAAAAEEAGPARSPEDETRHEEARRFARLLVSEIKLYNEDEVDRGRANKDLHQRLKDDIARSLEMYEKRIPPEIRAEHDYFQEELVRILADGDPDALGM